MYAPGSYHLFWLALGLLLLGLAVFAAICRRALLEYSRKVLLERLPPARQEAVEKSLGDDDDYVASFERIEFLLRGLVVFALVIGRFLWLDGFLTAAERSSEAEAEVLLPHRIVDLEPWSLAAIVAILAMEIGAVQFLLLDIGAVIIGTAWAEAWLTRFLGLIERVHRFTQPFAAIVERTAQLTTVFGVGGAQRTNAAMVEEEILSAAEEGGREGVLDSADIDMIESIIAFGDVEVSEVMTPRTEMICLDLDAPLQENLDRVIECGHSRIPVYLGHKDNVTGILYAKDLLRSLFLKEEIVLDSLVRKPYCVPRTKKIDELLQEFKLNRLHIAIVLDEYGGTDGLITIEDILEEIVGDISDEYEDDEPNSIERISDFVVDVDAATHIDDLNEELGIALPESENYDTIGGFLFASMGRIPAVGDTFKHDSVVFRVTQSDERRVHRLMIELPETTVEPKDVES